MASKQEHEARLAPGGPAGRTDGQAEAAFDSRALEILDCLVQAGYEAWIVGGAVRDFLMGCPLHDIDITTAAQPDKVIDLGERKGYKIVPTGLQHGTVTVVNRGLPVEVTTFRSDGTYSDSRRPDEVFFTERVEDDLARRDFTVNAMLWRPEIGCYDPMGGQDDLAAGLIRAVGDPERRFTEDALRMLRAVRFAAQLGFAIEPATAQAICALADRLCFVARERVTAELSRFVAAKAWPLQAGRALWPVIFPALAGGDFPGPAGEAVAPAAGTMAFDGEDMLEVETLPAELSCRLAAFYIYLKAGFTGGRVDLKDLAGQVAATVDQDLRLSKKDRNRLVANLELLSAWFAAAKTEGRAGAGCTDGTADPRPEPAAGECGRQGRFWVRRLISKFGERVYDHALALLCFLTEQQLFIDGQPVSQIRAFARRLLAVRENLKAAPQVYRVQDLAVGGADLVELGFAPGPALGDCLSVLLETVQAEQVANQRDDLIRLALSFNGREERFQPGEGAGGQPGEEGIQPGEEGIQPGG